MCRMGCPEVIITDQGREFNSLSAQLYQITNTQHIELLALTTPRQMSGLTMHADSF